MSAAKRKRYQPQFCPRREDLYAKYNWQPGDMVLVEESQDGERYVKVTRGTVVEQSASMPSEESASMPPEQSAPQDDTSPPPSPSPSPPPLKRAAEEMNEVVNVEDVDVDQQQGPDDCVEAVAKKPRLSVVNYSDTESEVENNDVEDVTVMDTADADTVVVLPKEDQNDMESNPPSEVVENLVVQSNAPVVPSLDIATVVVLPKEDQNDMESNPPSEVAENLVVQSNAPVVLSLETSIASTSTARNEAAAPVFRRSTRPNRCTMPSRYRDDAFRAMPSTSDIAAAAAAAVPKVAESVPKVVESVSKSAPPPAEPNRKATRNSRLPERYRSEDVIITKPTRAYTKSTTAPSTKVGKSHHIKCSVPRCGLTFIDQAALSRHVVLIHSGELEDDLRCRPCRKDFKHRSYFYRHLESKGHLEKMGII